MNPLGTFDTLSAARQCAEKHAAKLRRTVWYGLRGNRWVVFRRMPRRSWDIAYADPPNRNYAANPLRKEKR